MDEKQDKELLKRAKVGDKKAIAALYDQHYQAVYRYIFYRVSDQAAAEDLAAEVFIRMIRNLTGFRDRGKPLLAWLYTIARNLVIDHHRSNGNDDGIPIDDQIIQDLSPGPAQMLQNTQVEDCFRKALQKLPESQRQILIFRFVEDYETSRILELLDKSDRAVRSLQHRALRSMEKALIEENCL
ncbi:MAG: sigma-70 family RNA polymerase sigma factor [Chloroflexi bacterium]|nr:sigma-70 family RNA polymerase sigma factor [Chloroflexota bacterium]